MMTNNFDVLDEEMMIMDGFDDCIIGVCERFGQERIVAYDGDAVIDKLISNGMTSEEALEYFDFNQLGAWVGDRTPCFIFKQDGE
jgi:hypothetical protein